MDREEDLRKFVEDSGGEEAAIAKLEKACADMEAALNAPMTPREGRLLSQVDQLAARYRDLDSEERKEAVKACAEATGLAEADVLEWLNRLLAEGE